MSNLIDRVLIVGGTHGNEITGVHLVNKFARFPHLIQRDSFECQTLLANPHAIAANRRYIDRDLNRSFLNVDLANPDLMGCEDRLAKDFAARFGSKGRSHLDYIIDLHSSTANMGLTLLPSSRDPFDLRLCAYLSQLHPNVRIVYGLQAEQDDPMLRSMSALGCTIEVGAVAQGILDAKLFQLTEMLVAKTLDYLDAVNKGELPTVPANVTVYRSLRSIDYPRDAAGELQAMIHPQLQFQDYQPLHPGEPLFLSFSGETIAYDGESTAYPIFINEAAYYEKGIAMTLTERQEYPVAALLDKSR